MHPSTIHIGKRTSSAAAALNRIVCLNRETPQTSVICTDFRAGLQCPSVVGKMAESISVCLDRFVYHLKADKVGYSDVLQLGHCSAADNE